MAKKKGSSGRHGTRMSLNQYHKKNDQERSKHIAKGVPLDVNHHDIAKRLEWNKEKQKQRMSPIMKAQPSQSISNIPLLTSGGDMEISDDLTLANAFLAGLAHPERGIHHFRKGRHTEANRRLLQRTMIDAQRFVLDDKLVEHCVHASMDHPHRLLQMAQRAIPPFDCMWIEWNEFHKVETLAKAYKQKYHERIIDESINAPNQLGYLIQRVNGHFLFTCITEFPDSKTGQMKCWPNGTSFYFSNEIPIDYEWTLAPELDNNLEKPNQKELRDIQRRAMQHLIYPHYWEEYESHYSNELDWFASRILVAQSATMSVSDDQWRTGWTKDWMVEKTRRELVAMEGDLRFLICALGFLNYDHIVLQDTKPSKDVKHTRFGHRVPENEYRTVYIDLPQRCKTLRRGILTGTGSPKKQHQRRGHWRIYRDQRGRETHRTWIAPMTVGNPELGVIEHDYVLRGKKG